MDERLDNVFSEMGHKSDYYLTVGDAELDLKLAQAMERLWSARESVATEVTGKLPYYRKVMDEMGRDLREFMAARFPELALPESAPVSAPMLTDEPERVDGDALRP